VANLLYIVASYRLWKAFTPDPAKKKEQAKSKSAVSSLRMGIR